MIVNLFPTPVAILDNVIDEFERYSLLERVKTTEHIKHGAFRDNSSSSHQHGDNFIVDGSKLHTVITQHVNRYATEVFGIQQLKLSSSWSNIQGPGSKLLNHVHPNSKVSGVMYLNVDSSSSRIFFHNPNPFIPFEDYVNLTDWNQHFHWFEPKNCQLFLFPSWLSHGSHLDENHSQERISIAFNTVIA